MRDHGGMLDIVGLSADELRLYELLIAHGPLSAAAVRSDSGLPPAQVRTGLRTLRRLGLVVLEAGHPMRYAALSPDLALGPLLLGVERQLAVARQHTERLAQRHRAAAAGRQPRDLVEVVHGAEAISHRADQVMRGARHTVRFIDKPPYAQLQRSLHPVEAELLGRGVMVQGIYDRDGLALHDLRTDLEAGLELGEQARVIADAPTKMIIADDRLGLIPLRATPSVMESAVVVRQSALLSALAALFALVWRDAVPLALLGTPSAPRDGVPNEQDKRLLALLTTGMPDRTIAKQLGLSYRTFQRRLRALMAALDADTRFQAGLRASARGWVTVPVSRQR